MRRRIDAVPPSRVLVVASVDVKVRRVHGWGPRPVDEVVTLGEGDLLICSRTSAVVDDVFSLMHAGPRVGAKAAVSAKSTAKLLHK